MTAARPKPILLAALGAALAVVALAVAEGALRLAGFGGDRSNLFFERFGERVLEPGMFAPDPRRFFTLRPGYRHAPHHAGPNALGAWPFRGRPLAPAPERPRRVLVLGDSCAYGLPLPANQSLPAVLDRLLAERLGPDAALVANLGVPGYSTVQIRALCEEALERHRPDEVVLYPAAWNDQAPSLGRNDVELRERAREAGWIRRSALADALDRLGPAPAPAPSPGGGTRVPEHLVEGEVRAAIRACLERGAGVTVIVPPHPESTRATHERMFRDADAVRRAAAAEGVPAVDLQAELGAPERERACFADLVHPAPEGYARLARAVADVLVARAPAPAPADHEALAILDLSPRAVPALGDVELRLSVRGLAADAPLPAVVAGGAALLDVRREGDALIGTLPRLAPGEVRVLVQTERAVAVAAASLAVIAPRLEVEDGRVRVTSRPGDRARVLAARALVEPRHSARGALALDEQAFLPCDLVLELGPDGRAEAALPDLGGGPVHLQALVAPRGEPEKSDFALWTAPVRL